MSIGFVFTGGMASEPSGVELYDEYAVMRDWYEQVSEQTGFTKEELLTENYLETFRELGSSAPQRSRTIATVRRVAYCLGMMDILAEMGIFPDAISGYSLGCKGAACAAGSLSRTDLMDFLVRSTSLPLTPPGEPERGLALAVVPAAMDLEWFLSDTRPHVYLASDLGLLADGQARMAMFSGYLTELHELAAAAPQGCMIKPTGAFGGPHNPLQQFLVELTEPLVDDITFTDPKTGLVSSLDSRTLKSAEDVRAEFMANIVTTVRQQNMTDGLVRHGVQFGFVLGAGTANGMLNYPFPTVQILTPADIENAITMMADRQIVPTKSPF